MNRGIDDESTPVAAARNLFPSATILLQNSRSALFLFSSLSPSSIKSINTGLERYKHIQYLANS